MASRGIAEVLTGSLVLLAAAGFLGFAVMHSGQGATGAGYDLSASFDHIDGLNVGADVKIAGVKVGSVTAARIDPQTFQAIVTVNLANNIKLPKDSSAEIDSESLLGGKYMSLTPGGDETMLKPGGKIAITQSAVSLEQLLGKFIFSITSMKPSGAAK